MATFRQPGTVLTDHVLAVPLDHDDPAGETIDVYAREVVTGGTPDKPWLVFLQGGPGSASPRPIGRDSWIDRALDDYRVLLLDQRGTGRSTRISRQSLARRGSAHAQAEYLSHFRADSIVRDAELLRRHLLGDDGTWTVLGQSFGGFCAVTYLSFAPEGLREVLITGGLPGLDARAEDVYRATYPRVAAKNAAHYARYPGDVEAVRRIAAHLREHDVRLPNGGRLTVEAFQSLGLALGSSTGSHEIHYLTEDAFESAGVLSDAFLATVQHRLTCVTNPGYPLLHELCYGQGDGATGWAAQRVRAEHPEFDADDPVLFTGEMTYPWQFEVDPALVPMREAADLLAARPHWPRLYDPAALAANEVPVAAAVYYDDMYVDRELSLETAGRIAGARVWVTNEHEHDALRVSSGAVLDRLIAMVRGEV
ncbi:alpha/beta fold hydrolase [Dactylosporangium vinaceum]|uniref:Alpha/beta fold hydrolase n=1 Tax=Dactylosporangium vinaceum TaxID=53362 RepID=A0ABV5M2A2_9ACTN|nr:alpha/beta fold hydrolase [Dactylosporangium vinaceum]UAB99423.1 alpha/beta fold hydrolase [Dactylosporangium vinaceum]